MVQERLGKLREAMKKAGASCCIIPTSDYHNSEYVSDYFQVRRFFSGFTGSAGTLVVLLEEAALFTDGRYFIQAKEQLSGSGITLMKMGEPGVPDIKEYVKTKLGQGENIAFDGRVMTAAAGLGYEKIAEQKGGSVICDFDPAEGSWQDRPPFPVTKVFRLEDAFSGETAESKLSRLRGKMQEEDAACHILTTLDDIAWLFNLRANDVKCCPVLLSNAVITDKEAILFAKEEAFGDAEKKYLSENKIQLRDYDTFYDFIREYISDQNSQCTGTEDKKLLLCEKRINYRLKKEIGDSLPVINKENPTMLMKAIKNATEQENLRKAHLLDAVAVTKFMYWLKKGVGKEPITEISATEYLEKLRSENPSYIEPSFMTICAYGANGAIIHYEATRENFAKVEAKGMLMVDSGGHYYEGSTDITRTFILGEISPLMKQDFTMVARAMLRLKNARFLYGCNGTNLDILAREVFWQQGLDYKHGTGHGVGYLLNVHEGPNSFRHRMLPTEEKWVFEEGMVTTDEPGIYREGSHGIRTENELLCRLGERTEFGQFMYFEDLTYVPIDLDGIDVTLMEKREIEMLNDYHRSVYEKLAPYFEGEERDWLKYVTRYV